MTPRFPTGLKRFTKFRLRSPMIGATVLGLILGGMYHYDYRGRDVKLGNYSIDFGVSSNPRYLECEIYVRSNWPKLLAQKLRKTKRDVDRRVELEIRSTLFNDDGQLYWELQKLKKSIQDHVADVAGDLILGKSLTGEVVISKIYSR